MALARVTTKGQVTIPVDIRKALNIEEGDQLLFEVVQGHEARIRVVKRRNLLESLWCSACDTPVSGEGGHT